MHATASSAAWGNPSSKHGPSRAAFGYSETPDHHTPTFDAHALQWPTTEQRTFTFPPYTGAFVTPPLSVSYLVSRQQSGATAPHLPRVSIVINNYNYAQYVRHAIESALAQTYADVEVIVVDDGSTDDSRNVIEAYADKAVLVFKENGGQASAFNVGIARSTGELVVLLDSDDFLDPHAVACCVVKFPPGYSRAYFRMRVVDQNGSTLADPRAALPFQEIDGSALEEVAAGRGFPSMPTSGNVFNARVLKAILPVPEQEYRICADAFVFIKTALLGPVRSIDQELAAYRVHGANNFAAKLGSSLLDERRLLRQLENHVKCTRLIVECCNDARLPAHAYIRRTKADFYVVLLRCAAYAHMLSSPYAVDLNRRKLVREVWGFLAYGPGPWHKHLVKACCLWSLVLPPRRVRWTLLGLLARYFDRNSKRSVK